jgi:transposase
MPKPYSLDLRERVVGFVENGHSRRAAAAHFRVSVSFVVNLMKAVRARGSFEPKPSGGRRHAKLEPHRSFLLAQVVEKADITMPELAAALAATTGEKADPASLSRWLIRAGYRFKKRMARPVRKGVCAEIGGRSVCFNISGLEEQPPAKMEIRALRSS